MRQPVASIPSIVLSLVVAVTVVACNQVTEQTEQQRRTLAEQKIIQKYSDDVAQVDKLQKTFTDAWKAANEQTNIKDLKEAFESRVLPALESYVKALSAMPTESEDLEKIHKVLVDAYQDTLKAFKAFADGLTEDNIVERYKTLLGSTDKVHEAERTYFADLQTYYKKYNVNLVDQKPAPKAGRARPPRLVKPKPPRARPGPTRSRWRAPRSRF